MDWISVNYRMPKTTRDVLIFHDAYEVFMAKRIDNKWHLYYSDTGCKYDEYHQKGITHWMPLPKQPDLC